MVIRRREALIVGLCLVTAVVALLPYVEFSNGVRLNFYSLSEERKLGETSARQFESRFRLVNGPAIQAYLQQLGTKITSGVRNPGFRFEFRMLDSPALNAVALPGGFIYVTRGLALKVQSEGELAGVLAHEIAHVVSRHGTEQLSHAQLMGFISTLGGLASPLPDLVTNLERLSYSRGDELRSDDLAVVYLFQAGYHPESLASFFDVLLRATREAKLPDFLSTHPLSADRIVRTRQLFSTLPLDERLIRDSGEFHEFQALLRAGAVETPKK